MYELWCRAEKFLKSHDVDLIKDILVPNISVDKIVAFAALIYAIRAFNSSYNLSRANFTYQLIQSHRDLWSKIHALNLTRITDPNADPSTITSDEERYIIFLILHIEASFEAHRTNVLRVNRYSLVDIGEIFLLPLPKLVWSRIEMVNDKEFVKFIKFCAELAAGKKYESPIVRKIKSIIFYENIASTLKSIPLFLKKISLVIHRLYLFLKSL